MPKENNTPARKPAEVVIYETRNRFFEIIQTNGLGAGINRLILIDIVNMLAREEEMILSQHQQEQQQEQQKE